MQKNLFTKFYIYYAFISLERFTLQIICRGREIELTNITTVINIRTHYKRLRESPSILIAPYSKLNQIFKNFLWSANETLLSVTLF